MVGRVSIILFSDRGFALFFVFTREKLKQKKLMTKKSKLASTQDEGITTSVKCGRFFL